MALDAIALVSSDAGNMRCEGGVAPNFSRSPSFLRVHRDHGIAGGQFLFGARIDELELSIASAGCLADHRPENSLLEFDQRAARSFHKVSSSCEPKISKPFFCSSVKLKKESFFRHERSRTLWGDTSDELVAAQIPQ